MDNWTLIAGLGNPGGKYERTRHNAGFLVVDRLAEVLGCGWSADGKFQSSVARISVDGRRVMLCKPQTYMNLSGEAIGPLMQFYRVPVERLLVVVDDADLPVGAIRMKPDGSSGGHHGLESTAAHLGTSGFARQRIGIGRRDAQSREIAGHVLGKFGDDEWPIMTDVFGRAGEQIKCWLRNGIEQAMNQYNGTARPPQDQKKERL